MQNAQRDSVRVLKGVLVASVTVPLALFVYASWLGYQGARENSERQIERTRDVVNEHALKVFETVEYSLSEVQEAIRNMTDAQISANEENLHRRLRLQADKSPQIKSIWIFDRGGRALVNSLTYPVPSGDFSDRDYFKAHANADIGTYLGEVLAPRPPYGGAPFFGISRRRSSPDGSFAGVIQASVLPEYFEGFYARISRDAGSYILLARSDGRILARHPAFDRDAGTPSPGSSLVRAMQDARPEGVGTVTSSIDNVTRRIAYLRLPSFPAYVAAGLETSAIRAGWLSQMTAHLVFGLPATAALIALVVLALRRTRSLYDEAMGRKAAEDALKQAQRLEALGQLTGGVAHDFNNILMVVGGSAQRLKRRHGDPQDVRSLDMIESAVARGESLTRQLLSFSRRQNLSPKVVDIGDCVERFRDVLVQSVRADIDIAVTPPPRPVPVRIDVSEFQIALLNLTVNARDAMPGGGRIAIAIDVAALDADSAPNGAAGSFARIRFSDTGTGIPDEVRERVFEPFFTTKQIDKGTGLGLSQIYGFAQQSGGAIRIAQTGPGGTVFELLLPQSDEALAPEIPAREAASDIRAGTVLIVEDNAAVAAIASDNFRQLGFAVIDAASAEAAIAQLSKRGDIDLVFSDIVMPGMNGLELARLIRDHHPELRVVLTSGYSDNSDDALRDGFILLRKPYSLDALRRALAQVTAAPTLTAD